MKPLYSSYVCRFSYKCMFQDAGPGGRGLKAPLRVSRSLLRTAALLAPYVAPSLHFLDVDDVGGFLSCPSRKQLFQFVLAFCFSLHKNRLLWIERGQEGERWR